MRKAKSQPSTTPSPSSRTRKRELRLALLFVAACWPSTLSAAEPEPSEAERLRDEIRRLEDSSEADRRRIEQLEEKLEALTREKGGGAETVLQAIERAAGEHRFVIAGYGFGQHAWNERENDNTFTFGLDLVSLFRVNDWILFEADPEFEVEEGDVEVEAEYAQADLLFSDYATLVAGKVLLPFGQFIERGHQAWINKLVSFPLPFREENRIVPFSDVGAEMRGGVSVGALGVLDYTVYVANGPRFRAREEEGGEETGGEEATEEGEAAPEGEEVIEPPENVPRGLALDDNVEDANRAKGYGARFAVLPMPADGHLGQLRLGASTYDGKGDGGFWYFTWGVDAFYRYDVVDLRGELIWGRRDVPEGSDDRLGWYVQAAYALRRIAAAPFDRVELIGRYSGANSRGEDELRRPRQAAFGFDYWFTPSVVFKLEYDRDLPDDLEDDSEVLSQIAVGF